MNLIEVIKNIKDKIQKKSKDFKKAEIFITIWIATISIVILYAYFLSWNENSRDAKRYIDLVRINDELKIYHSKNNTYPLWDDSVSITANEQILTYQWNAWINFFKELWIEIINDPKKNKLFNYLNYYTYATDEKKQSFQLMAFYEWNQDEKYRPVSDRIPFSLWDSVGIAIENKFNRPIQETRLWVDILNTLDSYTIYNDNENILVGDRLKLKTFVSRLPISKSTSCLEIKNACWNKNWFYYINPISEIPNTRSLRVYCDMESDWGWWTRLYYKKWKNTCHNDENTYSRAIIEKLITKDFAVSDRTDSINSQWSWILKNIDFRDKNFDFQKFANVANCKTPTWTPWDMSYDQWYLSIKWTLSTLWNWSEMFFWCDYTRKVWDTWVTFNIWWTNQYGMTWEFIHSLCNNYSWHNNSITSRWDWENTRTIWVR